MLKACISGGLKVGGIQPRNHMRISKPLLLIARQPLNRHYQPPLAAQTAGRLNQFALARCLLAAGDGSEVSRWHAVRGFAKQVIACFHYLAHCLKEFPRLVNALLCVGFQAFGFG